MGTLIWNKMGTLVRNGFIHSKQMFPLFRNQAGVGEIIGRKWGNSLSANPTKWSNTFKQFVGKILKGLKRTKG